MRQAVLGAMVALAAGPALAATTSSFTIDGAVVTPTTVDAAALAALPSQSQSDTFKAGAATTTATFGGPTLWSVLTLAGLQSHSGVKNAALRDVVVARGSDGYAVAYAGGELDPKFGGRQTLVATSENGAPLGADGFARTTAPLDNKGGRYVSNLAGLSVVQAPSSTASGGGTTTSLSLGGLVAHPATLDAAGLATLPATTENVTYSQGSKQVSASFTGVSLWTLLTDAGLLTNPAIENEELRFYLLATGSDGYQATFSLGELDPAFGGTGAADLVATQENGAPLGSDGFARLVVPGDAAGGRYVSNLVSLTVIDATAVPEPKSHAMLWPAVLTLMGASVWRKTRASTLPA